MQVILYIPILILSIVSAFFIFGKLKLFFFGSNMLDLGLGIIGAWFLIFFICVTIWATIFVYLGIPILIIGGILCVIYFVRSKKKSRLDADQENEETMAEPSDDQETSESVKE